jgi:hypothetical protein
MRLGVVAWKGFGWASLLSLSVTAVALSESGCSSSDGASDPNGATGGSSNTGGSGKGAGGAATGGSATGGTAAGGVATGGGGTSGGTGGDTPVDPSCNKKVADPSTYPACSSCTGGRCVPKADFPDVQASLLDSCENDGICLPDSFVETKGNVLLKKCSSVLGNEGRCTSLCVPVARDLSAVLPQDTCAESERCAPCFNPNDGTPTGICDAGCDPGPTAQPILFTKCCGGRGDCIPRSNIPGNAKNNLAPETCTGANEPVCVPADIVANPNYKFPPCTASVSVVPGTPGMAGGDGVCVPRCIVDSTQYGPNINQGTCTDADDKCVPCKNPINNQASGACL